jgi:hypothetical protein
VPDTTDYLSRIRDYAEGKYPLDLQKQTPELLAQLLTKASNEQLTMRPTKDKWSIGSGATQGSWRSGRHADRFKCCPKPEF